ncbi:MAG: AAA family ATPase, partial [Desulfurobacteriaceae bacterium]
TANNNYREKIEEFINEVKKLQREGYGNVNAFITSLAHIINPEFYIPVSDNIATIVIKKWWEKITEHHNPTYGGRKDRCVGDDSRNLSCLKYFLIELNDLRIKLGFNSMVKVGFLLNRRKQEEKECLEKQEEETVSFSFPQNDLGETRTENAHSEFNLNTIFYGPPGTGKTYNIRKRAVEIVKKSKKVGNIEEEFKRLLFTSESDGDWRIAFITFHPSTSYETFMEGIWAETDENGNIRYKVKDGIFKVVTYHALWHALEKSKREKGFEDYEDMKKQVQKYLREHFKGNSSFDFENAENVVLIIDEINRGNIPSIFGELITLIEDAKRLGEKEEMCLILPYSREIFSVPKNLYIIGTMNTADRSIVLLDAALRRRFNFEEFLPDENLFKGISIGDLNFKAFLEKLNRKIKEKKGKDFTIGHAYFISLKKVPEEKKTEEFINILANKVLPLLQEYFYDDWETLIEILGGEEKEEIESYLIDKYGEIKYSKMVLNKEKILNILVKFTSGSQSEETEERGNVLCPIKTLMPN